MERGRRVEGGGAEEGGRWRAEGGVEGEGRKGGGGWADSLSGGASDPDLPSMRLV